MKIPLSFLSAFVRAW